MRSSNGMLSKVCLRGCEHLVARPRRSFLFWSGRRTLWVCVSILYGIRQSVESRLIIYLKFFGFLLTTTVGKLIRGFADTYV